jgi:hypothetical protein
MKFALIFETNNAAFTGDLEGEICRILRDAARRIDRDGLLLGHSEKLRDYDGNTVGTYHLETQK